MAGRSAVPLKPENLGSTIQSVKTGGMYAGFDTLR